jgi:FtsP/CotA-like multicopper oxidase with cupredoxin domain
MLKFGMLGTAALALPLERLVSAKTASDRIAASKFPKPFTTPFTIPPVLEPVRRSSTTDYYEIAMRSNMVDILPGFKTEIWGYNGIPAGPTIRATRGRPAVVRQINNLPARHPVLGYDAWTSVHLHGSGSLPQYDGYASDITHPGQYKDYRYPNYQERALSGTTTTGCTTPRRTPTWGWPRCTSCMTTSSSHCRSRTGATMYH